jgi:hypothetical protein
VTDEVWDDDRVKGFLELEPSDETDPDYYRLINAYEYMRADDFNRFLGFFNEAGRNMEAMSPQGQTLMQRIETHAASAEYSQYLSEHLEKRRET